jgi:tetratricopeptide (TPR) repeat protein
VEFDLGHFSAALEKYESAYRLRPVIPALFNIGQCYRRLNRLTEAANTFRTFIAKSPESPSVEKARVLLADVEEQINTSKK